MECINYETKYVPGASRTFNFTLRSGSEWSLKERWFRNVYSVYNFITLVKLRPVSSRHYFVDIEIRTLQQDLILEKTSKGLCTKIEIRIDAKEFLDRMPNLQTETCRNNSTRAFGIRCETLQYKLTLSPILELEYLENYIKNSTVESRMIESLADDVSCLITNPGFDYLYDIVLSNGITEVQAHKSILSARLPRFCLMLYKNVEVHKTSGLPLLKLNTPVLTDLVKYIYFACFPRSILTIANLYTTAVKLQFEGLDDVFLDVFMKKMSVEAVFYVSCFQNNFDEDSMTELYCNFHSVSESTVWTLVDIMFICLKTAYFKPYNVNYNATFLRLAIYMVAKIIMTST